MTTLTAKNNTLPPTIPGLNDLQTDKQLSQSLITEIRFKDGSELIQGSKVRQVENSLKERNSSSIDTYQNDPFRLEYPNNFLNQKLDQIVEQTLQSPQRCGCPFCSTSSNQTNTFLPQANDLASSNNSISRLPVANKPFTGNVYLDGILWGGNYWSVGSDRVITYSFLGAGSESFDDSFGGYATSAYNWANYEIAAMEQALNTWSNVANIKFVRAADNDRQATLKFYSVDSRDLNALGAYNPPGTSGMGFGYFNREGTGWNREGLKQGGYGFITLIHELGHAIGKAHPHDNGGGSPTYPGVASPFNDTGNFGLNQGVYTTMSYNDGLLSNNLPSGSNYGYQGTPMAFDIAAVQYLYGANTSYRTGNDTYILPSSNVSGTFYQSIWDVGGNDTITAAGINANATIDLREASLLGEVGGGGHISSVRGIFGGFTIGNKVDIENAIGGNGNDQIIGNGLDNVLYGGTGNDTLSGRGGADNFVFNLVSEGIDVISDFKSSQEDRILINQPFGASSINQFNFNLATGALSFNGRQFATLQNITTSNNFVLSRDLLLFKPQGSDLNGDSNFDILWRNSVTGENSVWLMNGTTLSSGVSLTPVGDRNWLLVDSGDFNGDTQSDIVWRNSVTGENSVWLMNGATLSSGVSLTSVGDLNWQMVSSGDFNRDGKSDIVWRNSATGENSIWLMNGTTLSSGVSLTSVTDLNWQIIDTGDFNGDTQSDIVWRNRTTGENSVWLMKGTTLSSWVSLTSVTDLNWQMVSSGDFNRDGKSDIAWRNSLTGENSAWLMDGTTLSSGVSLTSVTDLNWQIVG